MLDFEVLFGQKDGGKVQEQPFETGGVAARLCKRRTGRTYFKHLVYAVFGGGLNECRKSSDAYGTRGDKI